MNQRLSILPALIALTCALLVAGCSENPVGRKCFIGAEPDNETQTIISSPALECQSRTCLHTPLATGKTLPVDSELTPLCTAECSSNSDCDKVPESPCQTGFECIVPVITGDFCCRKMCVCRDFLLIPEDGEIPLPAACDPTNADNTCINLPGREPQ